MKQLIPRMAPIKSVKNESENVKSFRVKKMFNTFNPGQFIQLTVPGHGEITLGITNPLDANYLQFTVAKVGSVTNALFELKKGDWVGVRGPFGNGWPIRELIGKNVFMIAGGVGIVPIKPLIHYLSSHRKNFGKLELYYGARTAQDLLFDGELSRINGLHEEFTVDKRTHDWRGEVGFVTDICTGAQCLNAAAVICGPPVMMDNAAKALKKQGFKDHQIYVSIERLMQCGVGLCEHCRVGTKLVCRDGPVFRYDELKNVEKVIV